MESGSLVSSSTMIRDPDVESAERKREARAASDKVKILLDERRQAQKVLKAQVSQRWVSFAHQKISTGVSLS